MIMESGQWKLRVATAICSEDHLTLCSTDISAISENTAVCISYGEWKVAFIWYMTIQLTCIES